MAEAEAATKAIQWRRQRREIERRGMAAGSRRVEDGQERSEDRKSGEARMRGEERKQEDAVAGKGGRRRVASGGMEKGDAKGRGEGKEGEGGRQRRRTELQEPFCSLILDFIEYGEHYRRAICNTVFCSGIVSNKA